MIITPPNSRFCPWSTLWPPQYAVKIPGYPERGGPTSDDGRPVLKVVGGQLSGNADKAEEILIAAGVLFFERSNQLVRPIVKDVETFRGSKTSVGQLGAVSETYMRDMLGRVGGVVQVRPAVQKLGARKPAT